MHYKQASDKHLNIGCKGRTPFMDLPNFAWEASWMPGIAHALLLGVVKNVVQLLFRQKQQDVRYGAECFVSKETRLRMLSLVNQLGHTSGYPRRFTKFWRALLQPLPICPYTIYLRNDSLLPFFLGLTLMIRVTSRGCIMTLHGSLHVSASLLPAPH
jgi:hypothetical protein